ncbi:hypothetical protein [Paraburkholderia kururiensis]|uniref:hypothetical protein n=1 Tax=Paraburkholderia kururiensis TaxID=984307 RepID=UPI0018F322D3|nr:hypothetical protein [Paraburkholderia kururiensis]
MPCKIRIIERMAAARAARPFFPPARAGCIDQLMALMNTVTPVTGHAMFDMRLPRRAHASMHGIPTSSLLAPRLPHWLLPPHAMI